MEENQKLGAGIIIITGLTLLSSVLGIFINLNIIFGKNPMFEANKFHLIIDTIFRVVFLLSTILIIKYLIHIISWKIMNFKLTCSYKLWLILKYIIPIKI